MKTDIRALGLLLAVVGSAFALLEAAYAYGGAPLVDRIIGPWGLAAAMSPLPVLCVAAIVYGCEWAGLEP